jgi:hypothetical protein
LTYLAQGYSGLIYCRLPEHNRLALNGDETSTMKGDKENTNHLLPIFYAPVDT